MDVTENVSADTHNSWVSNDGAWTLATVVVDTTTLLALCSVNSRVSCVLATLT